MTVYPAATRLAAIGAPMIPRPMKPTVVISLPPAPHFRSGAHGPLLGWQPVEAVGAGAARLVLQADPAVVADLLQLPEVVVDVELAGPRLVAARGVGDLHVTRPSNVLSDHLPRIVTVDREVVDVAEQTHVGRAAVPLDPVHDRDRVGGGQQRVRRRPADGLEQYGAADPGGGGRRERQVLHGQGVLGLRWYARDAVAVQRVEVVAAELLAHGDRDVDVVAELVVAVRPGHQTAVAGRHVAGEE